MARTVRDAKLESRTARTALKVSGKPYYRSIDTGLHLGYRKGKTGGKWVVRLYIGNKDYKVETLDGLPDDVQDADGAAVLSFSHAQTQAREMFVAATRAAAEAVTQAAAPPAAPPLTVKRACESYIEYLKAERKTGVDTEQRLAKHVYPTLGARPVAALTKDDIEAVKRAMVRSDGADEDSKRKSQDSANRVLSMLKAALNQAFEDEAKGIPSDAAWRRVKPFKGVGRSRQVHLDAPQANRLINVCEGAFRRLVTAALLTGARAPHELVSLRVRDFRADLGTLSVEGKTGERNVVLTAEAVRWFQELVAGKEPDEMMLPKDDGTLWGKNHHIRPMQDAVAKAKLSEDTTIYALRHSYASQSILAGMNLKMLAENMGTSIRMLELHYGKFLAGSRRKLVEESAFKLGLKPSNVETLQVAS